MPAFRPERASPPPLLKSALKQNSSLARTLDTSESSATSAVLSGLSRDDVALIDAIIERAPSSATTFLTVFKAYNEILQERGLNAGDDVVYYRMLLKLGVVKGKDWGEKWRTVRRQLGYDTNSNQSSTTTMQPVRPLSGPSRGHAPRPYDVDSLTIHSQRESTEVFDTASVSHSHLSTEHGEDERQNSLGLLIRQPAYPPLPAISQFLPRTAPPRIPSQIPAAKSIASSTTEAPTVSFTTPPSYRAATRKPDYPQTRILTKPDDRRPIKTSEQTRKESAINAEEAWKKVRMLRDEKEADEFRDDKLLDRCWRVWLQGLEWIRDTGQHVDLARDNIVLGRGFNKWHSRATSLMDSYRHVGQLDDLRRLKVAWTAWRKRLKTKRVVEWRDGMRRRLASMRQKRDNRLKEDAWAKWRQLYQSHLSGQQYSLRLCVKVFQRWRMRLVEMDHLEGMADEFIQLRERALRRRYWQDLRRVASLSAIEQDILLLGGTRLKTRAMEVWRLRLLQSQRDDDKCNMFILKRYVRRWRAALLTTATLSQKADKHHMRQDAVLLRAVMHVWVARERGILLERVKAARLVQLAWNVWNIRKGAMEALEKKALVFASRSSSNILAGALRRWHEVQSTHHNAHRFAAQYHRDQMRYRFIKLWRQRLGINLRMIKQAKIARRYLLAKHAWYLWRDKLDDRRRQKTLRLFETKLLTKCFERWKAVAAHQQYLRYATHHVEQMVTSRLMRNSLKIWTTRVIDLKLRELEVREAHSRDVLASHFEKWRSLHQRHAEDVSLMQSYQDVKREETMRRMFHRWLTSARKLRHRRLTLERREEQMKKSRLTAAWDRWRERLEDERLRPLEHAIRLQFQHNLLFRAFALWHSKTKSGPAIRFDAMRVKTITWKIWRDAMPRALQAKSAREHERRFLLGRALDKWVKIYRTKIALKAVARARYLRLPTGAPRSLLSTIPSRSTPSSVSGRDARTSSPDRDSSVHSGKSPLRSAHTTSPQPLLRGGKIRANLWTELQKARRRSITSTDDPRPKG